jgi:hypothetical protein
MLARLFPLACAVCLAYAPLARADGILTGSATFDPVSRLYTYSYTLQQTGPYTADAIWLFSFTGGLSSSATAYAPKTYTMPAGWQFSWEVGDPVVGTPSNALNWTWSTPAGQGVAPGIDQAGFSFATSLPPGTIRFQLSQDLADVSAGYGGIPDGSGIVVGPSITTTSEPSTLALLFIGGLGLAWFAWGRRATTPAKRRHVAASQRGWRMSRDCTAARTASRSTRRDGCRALDSGVASCVELGRAVENRFASCVQFSSCLVFAHGWRGDANPSPAGRALNWLRRHGDVQDKHLFTMGTGKNTHEKPHRRAGSGSSRTLIRTHVAFPPTHATGRATVSWPP